MRMKITHPDDLAARNELIVGFYCSLIAVIVWSFPINDGG